MKTVTRNSASSAVCVMTHGICPASVYDDHVLESPVRKYIEAGGRLLWLGDVPFLYVQDNVHPQIFSKEGPQELLGIRAGYDYGCWNNSVPAAKTALGKTWGLVNPGSSVLAVYPEDVTAALSSFHSDYADSDLAVYWFRKLQSAIPVERIHHGLSGR